MKTGNTAAGTLAVKNWEAHRDEHVLLVLVNSILLVCQVGSEFSGFPGII